MEFLRAMSLGILMTIDLMAIITYIIVCKELENEKGFQKSILWLLTIFIIPTIYIWLN